MLYFDEDRQVWDVTGLCARNLIYDNYTTFEECEKALLLLLLRRHKSVAKVARIIGKTRGTVYKKLQTYDIPYPKTGKETSKC